MQNALRFSHLVPASQLPRVRPFTFCQIGPSLYSAQLRGGEAWPRRQHESPFKGFPGFAGSTGETPSGWSDLAIM